MGGAPTDPVTGPVLGPVLGPVSRMPGFTVCAVRPEASR